MVCVIQTELMSTTPRWSADNPLFLREGYCQGHQAVPSKQTSCPDTYYSALYFTENALEVSI